MFGWTANEKESFAVLDAYAAAGGNFIDTADMYSAWAPGNSGGESETIIGRWLAARGKRQEIIIGTKVGMHPRFKGLSAKTIGAAAENSLKRLGTDYIDLYYAHVDDEKTPLQWDRKSFKGHQKRERYETHSRQHENYRTFCSSAGGLLQLLKHRSAKVAC